MAGLVHGQTTELVTARGQHYGGPAAGQQRADLSLYRSKTPVQVRDLRFGDRIRPLGGIR